MSRMNVIAKKRVNIFGLIQYITVWYYSWVLWYIQFLCTFFVCNETIKNSPVLCNRCTCDNLSPSIPTHWESVNPKQPFQVTGSAHHKDKSTSDSLTLNKFFFPTQVIPLRKDSSEYQKMERFVREDGLLQDPIVSISRIQNVDLWELFCR